MSSAFCMTWNKGSCLSSPSFRLFVIRICYFFYWTLTHFELWRSMQQLNDFIVWKLCSFVDGEHGAVWVPTSFSDKFSPKVSFSLISGIKIVFKKLSFCHFVPFLKISSMRFSVRGLLILQNCEWNWENHIFPSPFGYFWTRNFVTAVSFIFVSFFSFAMTFHAEEDIYYLV